MLVVVAFLGLAFLVAPFNENVRKFLLDVMDRGIRVVECLMPPEEGSDKNDAVEGLKIAPFDSNSIGSAS
ncbi:hypothetical protein [Nonomuraea zeae]|uniref:hypothetical protein n=1 Tax=Nonomuraea zeae TaxID=1642303 RepID=UPI0036101230